MRASLSFRQHWVTKNCKYHSQNTVRGNDGSCDTAPVQWKDFCTLWQILVIERRPQRITGNIKSFPGIPRPVYGCVSDPWSKTGFSKRSHLKLVRSSSGTPQNTPPLWRDWSGAAIWCILWYLVSSRRRIPWGHILATHIQRRKIRLIYTTSGLYTFLLEIKFFSNFIS